MELIGAILLAGPLGYFGGTRRRGLVLYLVLWLIIFPVQTVVVHGDNPNDINPAYFVVNAVILAAGIGINRVGFSVRRRRTEPRPAS